MSVLVSMGRFFFVFGIASFVVSFLLSLVLSAFGVPVDPVMARMGTLIAVASLGAALAGVFGKLVAGVRVFMPSTAQGIGLATYLAYFLPAAYGIAAVLKELVTYLPAPPQVSLALATFVGAMAFPTMAYYLAAKLGYIPAD